MISRILLLFLVLCSFSSAYATHGLGGEITYVAVGPNAYDVTLSLYRDCNGVNSPSSRTLSWSSANCNVSGSTTLTRVTTGPNAIQDITPVCPSIQSSCGAGNGTFGVEQVTYIGTVNLPPCALGDDWVLSWNLCCRNNAITTIVGSPNIFTEATLDNSVIPLNSSPTFSNPPAAYSCVNDNVVYNQGAVDPDGDSLYFSFGDCLSNTATPVNYVGGYSGAAPFGPGVPVSIDSLTGAISFTPNATEVGIICILVQEYRNGVLIGSTTRDIQFTVLGCSNSAPTATGINGAPIANPADLTTSICTFGTICFTMNASNPAEPADLISLTYNGEIPDATFVVTNNASANPSGQFCWTPTQDDLGLNFFTITASDDACPLVGSSTTTYSINVVPGPGTVTAFSDQTICPGDNVNLSASANLPGVIYTWSPDSTLNSSSAANVIATPDLTTSYSVIGMFPDGCGSQDFATVTVEPLPNVSVSPQISNVCAGSNLTLTATAGGAGISLEWFDYTNTSLGTGTVTGTTSIIDVTLPSAPGTYNYIVEATDITTLCTSQDTATIRIASFAGNVCNVLYVSPSGNAANDGSSSAPTTLEEGLLRGGCNGTVLKLAVGTYNLDNPLAIPAFITIEGGYDPLSAWEKTSLPGATVINRTAANPEGNPNAQHLVAFYGNNAEGFRFQDVTITTADANQDGMSTYGLHLTACFNYSIVRTQILPGDAADGAAGIDGAPGLIGLDGLQGGAGEADQDSVTFEGPGADGGNGGASSGTTPFGAPGSNLLGISGFDATPFSRFGGGGGAGGPGGHRDFTTGLAGGGGGAAGIINGTGLSAVNCGGSGSGGAGGVQGDPGGDGADGADGIDGADGANGLIVPPSVHGTSYFQTGAQAEDGENGNGGSGGCGGGGSGRQQVCCGLAGAGNGGGGGGGGGEGGEGGTGGFGGGASFGIYLVSNGINGVVSQSSLIAGTAGLGGVGGAGGDAASNGPGTGAAGGIGGIGGNDSISQIGQGGAGGDGGAGGIGGSGANGANGVSNNVYLNSGLALTTADTSFDLAIQGIINVQDVNCINTPVGYNGGSTIFWDFGTTANPQNASASITSTEYTSIGRKDVFNGSNYEGFANMVLDASAIPTISVNAPFINGVYRICAGESINIRANEGGVGYIYHWDLGGGAVPNNYDGTPYEYLNNIVFNTPGTYIIELIYETNCCGSSPPGTITLNVEDVPSPVMPIGNICAGISNPSSITVNGLTPNGSVVWTPNVNLNRDDSTTVIAAPLAATTYFVTLTDSSGICNAQDSILVNLISVQNIDTSICLGQSFLTPLGNNISPINDTTFIDSLVGANLCDSLFNISIQVNDFTVEIIDTTICQDQTFTLNGVTYTNEGVFNDTARYMISNCDSIQYVVNLSKDSFAIENIDTTICQGQSFNFNSNSYTISGQYNDTVRYSVSNCDSIQYVINLEVDSFIIETIDTTICQGQSLTVNGTTYTASGIYNDTVRYIASSCDSIQYIINLAIDSFVVENIDTTICQGQTLTVNGATYTANGLYYDTARYTVTNCDSIQYIVNLTIDSFTTETIDTTICQGQSLTFNGSTYSASGQYNDTLRSTRSNCDSIHYIINLSIDSFIVENIDTTIGQGQTLTVNGTTYTVSGLYNDTARYTQSNCDSIQFVIDLEIDSFFIENIDTTICQGQSLTVNGITYTNPGVYTDTIKFALSGSDSLQYFINLEIDSFTIETIDTTICQSQTLTVNGITYTNSGSFNDTARYASSACDSIQYVINLAIDSFVIENIDTTICQGQTLTVNGTTYATSGTYNDTLRYTASLCDSVQFAINLRIDSFVIENIDTTICQGQTLTVNGITYTNSGSFIDTARYVLSSCDSIQYNINLAIDSFVIENIDTTICQGQTLTVNGQTYTATGVYYDTLNYTSSSCDSIQYVINLRIDSISIENIDTTLCQGQILTINGVNYTATGLYNDTARYAASSCDSIQFVINLAVDSFVIENIDTTICQGQTLTVNGFTYTNSGSFNDTARYVSSSCDSIQFVINLAIDSFVVENIDTTICQGQSLTINGATYNANGLYNDTALYSASSCDSVQYVINLSIDSFEIESLDTTICQGESVTVNGTTYTATGLYNDTASYAVSGCDSIQFIVNLTIDSITVDSVVATIAQGQSLTVNGAVYNATGLYFDTLRYAVTNCDSIQFVIDLTVDSFSIVNIDTAICQGQSLTVNGTTYTSSGLYNDTVRYTTSGGDSIQYVINLSIDSFIIETIDTTLCQGQSLTINGSTYTASGMYNDTARYTVSSCDSVQYIINLAIDSFIVENIDTTICQGQTLTVNGITYTANGLYNDTARFTATNCDSIQYNINLAIDSFIIETIDTTICQGQSITVNGLVYNSSGVFNDTARYAASSCDSVQFVIELTVDSITIENIDTSILQFQTLTVNGIVYNLSGLYFDTARYNQSNCDSIQFIINLNVDSFEIINIDTTICQGGSLTVNGTNYIASGQYFDTISYSQINADSIQFVINLGIDSFIVENIDTTICQGQTLTVNGITYASNGVYTDTARYTLSSCDSIQFNINLAIDTFVVENIDTTICQGQTLTVNGLTYTASGLYNDTASYLASSCDSIQYVINLAIDSFVVQNIDTIICQGQTLTVNGITYTSNGVYADTARYVASNCDSIQYNINLEIDSFVIENIDTTICQGQILTVNGMTYTASGLYNDTARYATSSCDSIQYVINLAIDSFEVENIDTIICQGQTLTVNGLTYSASGLYNDTAVYASSSCDSIQYVINLAIDSFEVENIDTTICQGQTLTVNGITYTSNGVYTDTARYLASSCDSVQYNINLAIDSFVVENIDTTICQGQTLTVNGVTYTASGLYNDTASYVASSCDSIQYVINLAIDSFVVENIDTTICQGQSLTVNGVTYTASGLYFDTAVYAGSSCDSIQYNINLIIDSFNVENTDTAICQGDTLTVNGVDYFATGSYTDSIFYPISGCLSDLFTIELVVNPLPIVTANSDDVDNTLCINSSITLFGSGDLSNSYAWNNGGIDNQAFNPSAGLSTFTLTGIDTNLCQNFDTMDVVGLPIYLDTVTTVICEDESYVLPDGTIINQAGEYITVLNSISNCDSTITTFVNVNNLGVFTALNDSIICDGFSMNLDVAAQNMTSIEWFVDDGSGAQTLIGNPDYLGATSGELTFNIDLALHENEYSVQMMDECGNVLSTNMTLEVYESQQVSNPIPDTVFCSHEIDVVSVDYNGFNYVWNTGDIGPDLLVESSGIYIVNFTENGTNCAMSDTIQIGIDDCIDNCVVLAPTGFSPDQNGMNDLFRVVTTCDEGFNSFSFSIYNRWGELVYNTSDWQEGWDGSFKGILAPIGTYTYYVEYVKQISLEEGSLKGSVTLLR